ncbi:uncharacterized protein LOC119997799 [Tripterygium wilfordii]|uniref:uncharacterized protein LOC119997799 n=1 Tax=Tripterygium wilfordii TaxID=458696 RepID=UPI0018F83E25|nr:uncharacterized protein LOC119997799 [Tripterygium wilfordii]
MGSLNWRLCVLSMANSSFLLHYYNNRRLSASSRSFFFIPTTLALLTSLFILLYIYTTSNLFTYHHQHHRHIHLKPPLDSSSIARSTHGRSIPISVQNGSINLYTNSQKGAPLVEDGSDGNVGSQRSSRVPFHSIGFQL